MAFAIRHPASIVAVLTALAATGAVLALARPQYQRRYESKMIDFSQVKHLTPAIVRRAFADQGVQLRYVTRFLGIQVFSNERLPFDADQLQVLVGPRTGRGSWGPVLEPYDERFDNVAVTYGERDERLLVRVKAAVSVLSSRGG